MKRILIFAASVLMLVFACVGLAACGEHTHKFGEYVYNNDATCTEDGTETATCECGETDTRVKEGTALGHEFGEYTSDGNVTCTEDGTETAKCIRCTETVSRPVSALGHSLKKHDGTATCTEFGTVPYYECERCEKKFKDRKATMEETDFTPRVLGHEFTVENACIRFNECGAQWECTDGLDYKLNDEGGYTVTGKGKVDSNGATVDLTIPYGYQGKYVTAIADYVFTDVRAKSLTFPDSITNIGERAFYNNTSLKGELKLPKNLTNIGKGAFSGCYNMGGALEIPDSVTYIGPEAFSRNHFTGLKLPNGITKIEAETFLGNMYMAGELVIPDSVVEICESAFSNDQEFTSIKFGKNLEIIGTSAFYGLRKITSVVIPDGVTTIRGGAFQSCNELADVTIADSVVKVGQNAFDNTKFIDDPDNWVDGVALYAGLNLMEVKATAEGAFVVRDGTKSISDNAFISCVNITSISIPEGVLTVGARAFNGCRTLDHVNIPSTVVSIGNLAFSNCQALTSVEFAEPNGWVVSKTSDLETATEVFGLEDGPTAAGYLSTEYLDRNWFKI